MYPDYLIHYGVKGMKWGVRKTQRKIQKLNNYNRKIERKAQALSKLESMDWAVKNDPVDKWHVTNLDRSINASRAAISQMEQMGRRKLKDIMSRLPEGFTLYYRINYDGSGSYGLEKKSE